MKKLISILCHSLSLSLCSFAQVSVGAGYLNQSLSEHNPRLLKGFYAGFGYNISLWEHISIYPGLYYLRTQGGLSGTGNLWLTFTPATPPVTDEKEYFKNNTLLLPLQVSCSIFSSPKFSLFILGGPSLSYELSTEYDYSCSFWEFSCKDLLSLEKTFQTNIDYSRWSIGIGGRIGVDFFEHYRITAGYEYGINNRLSGREYATLQDDQSMHTERFQVGIAYVF